MQAGKLRHKITIQKLDQSGVDDNGDRVTTWTTRYANVPASITTLSGREREFASQIVADANAKIVIRYHADIEVADRITFGSRVLNIGHIDNIDQRNIELHLLVTEEK